MRKTPPLLYFKLVSIPSEITERRDDMPFLFPDRFQSFNLNVERPTIMAILNVTPDSFSDGGRFNTNSADAFDIDVDAVVEAARNAIRDGAEILDVGGESTKPGAEPVDEAEETRRVVPVVQALARTFDVPISIDTRRPCVADAALEVGASIVNDVAAGRYIDSQRRLADETESGFPEEMAEVVARRGASVVIMHMRGIPKTMQAATPEYPGGVVDEILAFLKRRRDAFVAVGVAPERIAFDPGLGFGKTFDQNWSLIANLERFRELGGPVLLGFSRKTFLRETARRYNEGRGLTDEAALPDVATLDQETATLSALVAARGVEILRVHNVRQTALALEIARRSVVEAPQT